MPWRPATDSAATPRAQYGYSHPKNQPPFFATSRYLRNPVIEFPQQRFESFGRCPEELLLRTHLPTISSATPHLSHILCIFSGEFLRCFPQTAAECLAPESSQQRQPPFLPDVHTDHR